MIDRNIEIPITPNRYIEIFVVLAGIYGYSQTVEALATNVDERLDSLSLDEVRSLRQMLTNLIWDWMPGGGTAAIAADRIIDNLTEKGLIR